MVKLVIADDEFYIRYGLEQTLPWDEYGIEVVGLAANGIEALRLIRDNSPQIVFTDVKMPDMNGIELLKAIRADFPHIKVIIISGYNDFEYVKKTLVYGVENYILKPIDNEEISETLLATINKIEREDNRIDIQSDNTNIIRENILFRLVSGHISISEAEERLALLKISFTGKHCMVGTVKFLYSPEGEKRKTQDIMRWVQSREFPLGSWFFFPDHAGIMLVLIIFDGTVSDKMIENMFQDLAGQIKEEFSLDLFLTLGCRVDSQEDLFRSYRESRELQKFIYSKSPNILLTGPAVGKEKRHIRSSLLVQELWDAVENGDKDRWEVFLNDLSEDWKDRDVDQIKSLILELAAELLVRARQYNLKENEPSSLYGELFGKSKEEALGWLRKRAAHISREITDHHSLSLTDKIVEYVDKNYTDPISLKTLAAEFSVNPSYLGQIFKRKTGRLFSDYLNRKRIARAKELMKESTKKLNVIAREAGYSDGDYFYKVFKKYTGRYPLEYREGHE